jgi:hypothetical protein
MRSKSVSTDELRTPAKAKVDDSDSDNESADESHKSTNEKPPLPEAANGMGHVSCASTGSASSSSRVEVSGKPTESTSRPGRFELLDQWERRIEKNRSGSIVSMGVEKGSTGKPGDDKAPATDFNFALEKQWGFGDLM